MSDREETSVVFEVQRRPRRRKGVFSRTVRERRLVLLLLAPATGCSGGVAIGGSDLEIRVQAPDQEVEFGRPFPLRVVRVFSRGMVPGEWSDESPVPLVLRLEETIRREDDRRVEETRRYQAWVFGRDSVAIPALSFKVWPEDGGTPLVATSEALRLKVKSALPPGDPGVAELPGDLMPEPFAWRRWMCGGAGALALIALLGWYGRRRALHRQRMDAAPRSPDPVNPPLPPHHEALERLRRLQGQPPRSLEEVQAYYIEASALVRDYLELRFAMRLHQMTSEELLAFTHIARVLEPPLSDLFAQFLTQCDFVKFARRNPPGPEQQQLLHDAESFVLQTRPREALESSGSAAAAGNGAR